MDDIKYNRHRLALLNENLELAIKNTNKYPKGSDERFEKVNAIIHEIASIQYNLAIAEFVASEAVEN